MAAHAPFSFSVELILERCDLEIQANGRDHHTADLCHEKLVLRRGQRFRLTLYFEGRGYESSVDNLTFSAVTGGYLGSPLCPAPGGDGADEFHLFPKPFPSSEDLSCH